MLDLPHKCKPVKDIYYFSKLHNASFHMKVRVIKQAHLVISTAHSIILQSNDYDKML